MPIINFIPIFVVQKNEADEDNNKDDVKLYYECPTYKTGERYGTLLTTGHSTNYVMNIELNSEVDTANRVKRSVAMLT